MMMTITKKKLYKIQNKLQTFLYKRRIQWLQKKKLEVGFTATIRLNDPGCSWLLFYCDG